nr:hypothetical protein [Clostridia bacterium]
MSTTEIMICFDTEDFTSCRAADAIRDTALLLTDAGIRANYMLVGLLAKQLVQWRRFDVLDALKNHEIQSHSKGHSYHPTICEYTDIADAEQAIALALREESECMGMIRAATGADKIWAGVPAGSNKSDAAMYAYGMLGLDAYCDTYVGLPDGGPVWCCGLLQIPYVCAFENICYRNSDADNDALIEQLAKRKRAIIYNHPNMITHSNFWDKVNYDGENKHEWGKWEEAPRRPAHETIRFYERMREFIYKLKEAKNEDGTPKFVFRTISEVVQAEKRTRTVRRADLPKYLDALKKAYAEDNFTPLTLSHAGAEPISLSECLYAA